jgi:predicted nucleic acid-binding Zn ribbon protein
MNGNNILLTPVDGWISKVNDGNKCGVCGHGFDDGGVCNNKHERGQIYYISPVGIKKPSPITLVLVISSNPCKCDVCGAAVTEGDDYCDNHHRKVGQEVKRQVVVQN